MLIDVVKKNLVIMKMRGMFMFLFCLDVSIFFVLFVSCVFVDIVEVEWIVLYFDFIVICCDLVSDLVFVIVWVDVVIGGFVDEV